MRRPYMPPLLCAIISRAHCPRLSLFRSESIVRHPRVVIAHLSVCGDNQNADVSRNPGRNQFAHAQLRLQTSGASRAEVGRYAVII